MRITESHDIHPVMKAMNHPEQSPLMTEPMNALNMVLKAAADSESSHDIVNEFDRYSQEIAKIDSVEVQMPRAHARGTTVFCTKLSVRRLGRSDCIGN
jgi:hypothetical protein